MQLSLKETIIKLSNLTTQPKENESTYMHRVHQMHD